MSDGNPKRPRLTAVISRENWQGLQQSNALPRPRTCGTPSSTAAETPSSDPTYTPDTTPSSQSSRGTSRSTTPASAVNGRLRAISMLPLLDLSDEDVSDASDASDDNAGTATSVAADTRPSGDDSGTTANGDGPARNNGGGPSSAATDTATPAPTRGEAWRAEHSEGFDRNALRAEITTDHQGAGSRQRRAGR